MHIKHAQRSVLSLLRVYSLAIGPWMSSYNYTIIIYSVSLGDDIKYEKSKGP